MKLVLVLISIVLVAITYALAQGKLVDAGFLASTNILLLMSYRREGTCRAQDG